MRELRVIVDQTYVGEFFREVFFAGSASEQRNVIGAIRRYRMNYPIFVHSDVKNRFFIGRKIARAAVCAHFVKHTRGCFFVVEIVSERIQPRVFVPSVERGGNNRFVV